MTITGLYNEFSPPKNGVISITNYTKHTHITSQVLKLAFLEVINRKVGVLCLLFVCIR